MDGHTRRQRQGRKRRDAAPTRNPNHPHPPASNDNGKDNLNHDDTVTVLHQPASSDVRSPLTGTGPSSELGAARRRCDGARPCPTRAHATHQPYLADAQARRTRLKRRCILWHHLNTKSSPPLRALGKAATSAFHSAIVVFTCSGSRCDHAPRSVPTCLAHSLA